MVQEDRALLEAARGGDPRALEVLLERVQPRLHRFGMKLCRDPELAKDVVQDTLLAAARGVRDFRGASSLSTWLYTIARSFCIKQRRKGGAAQGATERSLDSDGAREAARLVDPAPAPDELLADKEVERAVAHAIGALEPSHREVLVLRDIEGLSAKQVAAVLGISVEAVKSRLHRARVALRAQIAPAAALEPGCDSRPGD